MENSLAVSQNAKHKVTMKWSEVPQSCLTLCNPMDCSLQGSSVHGIFQARILEWLPLPSPGYLPDPGTEPGSPALQADSYHLRHQGSLRVLNVTLKSMASCLPFALGYHFYWDFWWPDMFTKDMPIGWVSRSWGMSPPHWNIHRGWMVQTAGQRWSRLSPCHLTAHNESSMDTEV